MIAKPSARKVRLLPIFKTAVRGDKAMKRKANAALVQVRDETNLQHYRDKLHRAKEGAVEGMEGQWRSSFSILAPLLVELMRVNKAINVALEVDQGNSFYRFFVAFGASISSHCYNVPVAEFDGTHSPHSNYNDVILSLVGGDGNGQCHACHGVCAVKDKDNIVLFFLDCIEAGIDLVNVVVMCDSGHIQRYVKPV